MKIVLAYSGGLDTSIILHWLKKTYDAEIIAYTANVGQLGENMDKIREAALATGAAEAIVEDVQEEFVRDCVFPAIRANAVYEWYYLLGTALARPAIARGHGGSRKEIRRRRDFSRRYRQGQRPGAVRALGLCAPTRDQDHCTVAGVEPQRQERSGCVRRSQRCPDARGAQARIFDGRQSDARFVRGRRARRPLGEPARRHVPDDK